MRDAPPLMKVKEVIELTRLSRRTLGRYIVAGRLRALRGGVTGAERGAARLLFPRCEVARLLSELAVQGEP